MKSKKYGYTLIELLIVIGIITVIMLVTMRFTSSRIDNLKSQTSKDDFRQKYEELLLSNISSSYYNQKRYTNVHVLFSSGKNNFSYYLQDESGISSRNYIGFSDSKRKITSLSGDNQAIGQLYVKLKPYTLGCEICKQITCQTGDFQQAFIQTKSSTKTYCFKISKDTCKLETSSCR